MERYCSTGQRPQRAVAPTEEEYTFVHSFSLEEWVLRVISLKICNSHKDEAVPVHAMKSYGGLHGQSYF
jgi:hypothetical protein